MANWGNKTYYQALLLMLAVLAACAQTPTESHGLPAPTVSVTPPRVTTAAPTPTQSPTAVDLAAQSPVPTPTRTLLDALPVGQYVVYANERGDYTFAVSMQGVIEGQLPMGIGDYGQLAPNGKQIVFFQGQTASTGGSQGNLALMDLETGNIANIPGGDECSLWATFSPDGRNLAATCGYPKELVALSIQNGATTPIANCSKGTSGAPPCFLPTWSPDGKWIAYSMIIGSQNDDPRNGLYLFNTACLPDPQSCIAKTEGPFKLTFHGTGYFAWSPDSKSIVTAYRQLILFDVRTHQSRVLKKFDYDGLGRVAWSPDGKWIAFNYMNGPQTPFDVYVISVESGQISRLTNYTAANKYVLFWLSVAK